MKLEEIKKFVEELRGLSSEELAKRENELKKELFIQPLKILKIINLCTPLKRPQLNF